MAGHPEDTFSSPVPVKLGGTNLKDAPPLDAPLVGNGRGGYKFGFPLPPGGAIPFEYDDATVTDRSNIITTREAQSPIDNTKHRIFNQGTTDGELGFGALDDGASILSGVDCTAAGDDSCVSGGSNVMTAGVCAHGEGKNNIAGCEASHVEGENNLVNGDYGHAEGFTTIVGPVQLPATLPDGGTTVTIAFIDWTHYLPVGFGTTVTLQDPLTGRIYKRTIAFGTVAFAAGNTTFDITSPLPAGITQVLVFCDAVGGAAHAEGQNTVAIFSSDHAEGGGSIAAGGISHAEGSTFALGTNSHSEGGGGFAIGALSHEEGNSNFAYGSAAHAEGAGGAANGDYSHTEGTGCQTGFAVRNFTISAGGTTVTIAGIDVTNEYANGDDVTILYTEGFFPAQVRKGIVTPPVFAAGDTTFDISGSFSPSATGGQIVDPSKANAAHAEGSQTTATGESSHTEGDHTTASGVSAHAEGHNTLARGDYSHTEGDGTVTVRDRAHAEGFGTTASGASSHAEGERSVADKTGGHAQGVGSYNHWEGGDAYASGNFDSDVPGDVQGQCVVLRGETPGTGANESVALKFGDAGTTELSVESNKSYGIRIDCQATEMSIAAGTPRGVFQSVAAIVHVKSDGTVLVVGSTPVFPQIEEAGFVGATLVLSAGGANTLTVTFATGIGNTTKSRIGATVRVTEVLHD